MDGEPATCEVIQQALLRLEPETRHEVIQAMLVIQAARARGAPMRTLLPVLAPVVPFVYDCGFLLLAGI